MQNFYEDKMNDLIVDIEDLETAINSLKKLKHTPEVINAILKIDDIIERKKIEFHNYEHQMQREYGYGFNRN